MGFRFFVSWPEVLARRSSCLLPSEPYAEHAHVEQRQPEGDREDHYRQRGPVAETQILEESVEGVERDRLGRRTRSAAGEHVDEIEDPESVERSEDQSHENRRLEERERDVPQLPPCVGAIDRGSLGKTEIDGLET